MFRRIILWFTRKYRYTTASRWAVLAIDIFTLIVAFAITDVLRLRMASHIDWPSLIVKLAAFIVLASICYVVIGTHRAIIRHSGMYDIYKIIIANVMAAAVLVVFHLVNNNHPIIQNRYTPAYSEILMTFALQIAAMLSMRLLLQRIYNDYIRRHRPICNVVIYGAGAAGTIASNALQQDMVHEYRIVAYMDDNSKKRDTALNGVRVMDPKEVLNREYITKHNVEVLLIAIPSIKVARKQEIMTKGLDLGLTVKSVPHIKNWINDTFTVNQIHDIQIEDLLERESIKLDNGKIVSSYRLPLENAK